MTCFAVWAAILLNPCKSKGTLTVSPSTISGKIFLALSMEISSSLFETFETIFLVSKTDMSHVFGSILRSILILPPNFFLVAESKADRKVSINISLDIPFSLLIWSIT
jgi:hypothetical protein